jgi:hypothetical protein
VIGGFYFFAATKDGNVCDDDGVEAGVQRSGLVYFIDEIRRPALTNEVDFVAFLCGGMNN